MAVFLCGNIQPVQLCKPLLKNMGHLLLVLLFTCAEVINPRFQKTALLIKKVESHKLTNPWNEWCCEQELTAIRQTADVTGMVIVVLNRDKFRFAHREEYALDPMKASR
ncbi:MAG: hypothetical protein JWM59_1112 [Verrucomicrobiales bacterium]|nr:hypothetical protein [Verrucomicrobiales bacterium]